MYLELSPKYSQKFDEYCLARNRKTSISDEQKAIIWRICEYMYIVEKEYENISYSNLDEFFRDYNFPYNQTSYKKLLTEVSCDNSNNVLFSTEKDSYLEKLNNDFSIILNIPMLNFIDDYYKTHNITETLSYDEKLAIIDFIDKAVEINGCYEIFDALPKRKAYSLLDVIFNEITLPADSSSFIVFLNQSKDKELVEKIELIVNSYFKRF